MNLIVVSNRVSSLSDKSAAAGGLAAALYQGMRSSGGTWFGWSGKTVEGEPDPATINPAGSAKLATIDYPDSDFTGFYNGMANGTLWPVMHNRVDLMVYDPAYLEKYAAINKLVATRIAQMETPDAYYWIHDYHFLMVGSYLKQMGVKRPLGFFLHTPFGSVSCVECVPGHKHLFGHLLAYDLIGFQTQDDMNRFVRYAKRDLGAEEVEPGTLRSINGLTHLGVYPVGIDVDEYGLMARNAQTDTEVVKLKAALGDIDMMIGVDRLDYSKGLPHRFRAFDRLLTQSPQWREKVNLLQIAPLTRSDVSAYKDLQDELAGLMGTINGRFGTVSWQPIRYTNESYTPAVLSGFYRLAQVCCVTPLRDGMNLVAKEFVACQDEADPGVLVLSQFAGAAQELDAALIVNPYDTDQVAAALDAALSMPLGERKDRWRAMMKVLRVQDVSAWFNGFVSALEAPASRRKTWFKRPKH